MISLMNVFDRNNKNMSSHHGIAIGPILFVVAILAVLVGALAAGSSSFGSSTVEERNKTLGGALIEQGTNMKMAFERLYGSAISLESIIISQSFSTANGDAAFFGPKGGGIMPMSPPSATVPASGVNTWRFVEHADLPGIGSSGANDAAIVIGIANQAMCKAINAIIFGAGSTQATSLPTGTSMSVTLNDVGSCSDVTMLTTTSGCNIAANTFDASTVTGVDGFAQACIDDGTGTYYYYQLLLAQ